MNGNFLASKAREKEERKGEQKKEGKKKGGKEKTTENMKIKGKGWGREKKSCISFDPHFPVQVFSRYPKILICFLPLMTDFSVSHNRNLC